MNVNIEKTDSLTPKQSVVFLVHDTAKLKQYGFTAGEIAYIKTRNHNKETNEFAFNRLQKWDFVVFVKKDDTSPAAMEALRKAGNNISGKIQANDIEELTIADLQNTPSGALAFAEGLVLGSYRFMRYRKSKDAKKTLPVLKKVLLFSPNYSQPELAELNIILEAVCHARDLVNEPVSYLTAEKLANEAENLCRPLGVKVEVMNKGRIESLKMGGLLAVNKGSTDPPTFTVMEWKPKGHTNKNPFIFVGKGVVYDTGGISLKPNAAMETMKCDMAGAAAVIATMFAIAKAGLPIYTVGLVPATDNRPDGNAQVPGDIITMHDGTTVEVLNTDAEGRLILADALSYAKKYKPALVIDLATLTGSAQAAIGKFAMVAMGSRSVIFMKELKDSGENVYERIVEFPLWDEYKEMLKSDVADIKNTGGTFAGAITAGKFLEHFTDYPWIHLDIAGPAFMEKRDSYRGQGGTGWGVRILFDFLRNKTT